MIEEDGVHEHAADLRQRRLGHDRPDEVPPEMAAIFVKSVEVSRERIPEDPDQEMRSAERTREVATTNCDGLIVMAEALLSQIAATEVKSASM